MKAKARRVYPDWPKAAWYADTLHACSSFCCGNPRKWFKQKTIQERRRLQDESHDWAS